MQILYVAWYHLIFLPASNLKGTFICNNKCFRNEQSIKQYQRMRKQIWRTHNMNSGNERHAVTVDRDSRNGRVLAVRSDPTCKHTKKTQKTSVTGWLFINYCWETMVSQICIECCRDSVLINVADIGDLDSPAGWRQFKGLSGAHVTFLWYSCRRLFCLTSILTISKLSRISTCITMFLNLLVTNFAEVK